MNGRCDKTFNIINIFKCILIITEKTALYKYIKQFIQFFYELMTILINYQSSVIHCVLEHINQQLFRNVVIYTFLCYSSLSSESHFQIYSYTAFLEERL